MYIMHSDYSYPHPPTCIPLPFLTNLFLTLMFFVCLFCDPLTEATCVTLGLKLSVEAS